MSQLIRNTLDRFRIVQFFLSLLPDHDYGAIVADEGAEPSKLSGSLKLPVGKRLPFILDGSSNSSSSASWRGHGGASQCYADSEFSTDVVVSLNGDVIANYHSSGMGKMKKNRKLDRLLISSPVTRKDSPCCKSPIIMTPLNDMKNHTSGSTELLSRQDNELLTPLGLLRTTTIKTCSPRCSNNVIITSGNNNRQEENNNNLHNNHNNNLNSHIDCTPHDETSSYICYTNISPISLSDSIVSTTTISCDIPIAFKMTLPMIGKWETILSRSKPLDPLFKQFGIPYFKRVVVDRLPLQFTQSIIDDDRLLAEIHLPIQSRYMKWNLDGSQSIDNDPDCGQWTGSIHITQDFVISWFDHGKPFTAIQHHRSHKTIGSVVETRCLLPDSQHGRILYLSYQLTPSKNPEKIVFVERILKPLTN